MHGTSFSLLCFCSLCGLGIISPPSNPEEKRKRFEWSMKGSTQDRAEAANCSCFPVVQHLGLWLP